MSAQVTFWAWKQEIDHAPTKLVLLCLADHSAEPNSETGAVCFPSVKTICKETSQCETTVKNAIAKLMALGYITKSPRFRENGSHTSSSIEINIGSMKVEVRGKGQQEVGRVATEGGSLHDPGVGRSTTPQNQPVLNPPEESSPKGSQKSEDDLKVQEIISHLEAATGREFTLNAIRRSSILRRLSEVKGDIAGVKRMITRQVDLWATNPEMAQYLTPDTLFRQSKFVKYWDNRNQPVVRDAAALRRAIEPHANIVSNSPAFPGGPRWHDQATAEQRQAYQAACVAIRKLDPDFNFDSLRR